MHAHVLWAVATRVHVGYQCSLHNCIDASTCKVICLYKYVCCGGDNGRITVCSLSIKLCMQTAECDFEDKQ